MSGDLLRARLDVGNETLSKVRATYTWRHVNGVPGPLHLVNRERELGLDRRETG